MNTKQIHIEPSELNDIDTDDLSDSDDDSNTSTDSASSTVNDEPLPNIDGEISDDSLSIDAFCPSISSDDKSEELNDDEFGLYDEIECEEIRECQMVTKCEETYGIDEHIFNPTEMNDLKVRENALIERNQKGYYRCKVRHSKLYKEMTAAFAPYIQKDMLVQLQHNWNTQKNEALNTSVSFYAPKNKTYSTTQSLDTRVAIAAGVQILGYSGFWCRVFEMFEMTVDDNLLQSLIQRDLAKTNKTKREQSKEGKMRKSDGKYKKFNKAQQEALDSYSAGLGYESGLALSAAIKEIKDSPVERNPKGTPKEKLRCKYHHADYCDVLGHSDARSPFCKMKMLNVSERKAIEKIIFKETIERQLVITSNLRKYIFKNSKHLFYVKLLLLLFSYIAMSYISFVLI